MATTLPVLLIYAGATGEALKGLFATRGFATTIVGGLADLQAYLTGHAPIVAILDFELEGADKALEALAARGTRPALVGIAGASEEIPGEDSLDAAFRRPVDPARLFTRVVQVVARKKGAAKANRLTGIVAVVRGNALFHLAEQELRTAVPPVNAGAILEKALRDLGADPKTLAPGDLAAMLESGRLAEALDPFGEAGAIRAALARMGGLLR